MSDTIKSNKIPAASVEEFINLGKSEDPVALSFPVNIRETEHKYELKMPAPGFKRSDFNITSEGGLLTITALAKHEKATEDDHYARKEYMVSSISRAFSLPEDVLVDHVSAEYRDGVLTIDFKKTDRFLVGKKRIKVD